MFSSELKSVVLFSEIIICLPAILKDLLIFKIVFQLTQLHELHASSILNHMFYEENII